MKDAQQLANAIKRQSVEEVKAALALGADPNANTQGLSMLGWHANAACLVLDYEQPSWLEILHTLLDAGANPNLPVDKQGKDYLLHCLCQHSVIPAMRLMLNYCANPNLIFEGTALDWLDGDYSYQETCHLPSWYRGRVLIEYAIPQDVLKDEKAAAIWLVARHQRGWSLLRKAGGLAHWELQEGPITERLRLAPDVLGGLFTKYARPDKAFMASLGGELRRRISRWVDDYKDPNLLGYDAQAVRNFDYAAHLTEGMAIGNALAPFLPQETALELTMPTAESIAAKSHMTNTYCWSTEKQAWDEKEDWREKLSPDWFEPEPAIYAYLRRPVNSPWIPEGNGIPHEVVKMTIGGMSQLSAWREYLGMTQDQVASTMNISLSAIVQIENSTFHDKITLEKYASALGITPEKLA